MTRIRTLAALSAVLLTLPLQAATYYVSPDGDDSGAGTEAAPWRTLRTGLTSLLPGDTLYVRGGTYMEVLGSSSGISIHPGTESEPISVKAYPGERPVLQGLLWLARPSYWTIDGLNVTWQAGLPSRAHMVKITGGVGWTFENAEVWGAHSYAGLLIAGNDANEPSNWLVTGCRIHDTFASNDRNQDHLIYCNTGVSSGPGVIERCLLYRATNGEGVKIAGADAGEGAAKVTVRYNTIADTAQGVLVGWKSSDNLVRRNLIVRTAANYGAVRGFQLTGANNVATENLCWDTEAPILNYDGGLGVTDGGGNLMLDPVLDGGLRPTNPDAKGYGRFAATVDPPPPSDTVYYVQATVTCNPDLSAAVDGLVAETGVWERHDFATLDEAIAFLREHWPAPK